MPAALPALCALLLAAPALPTARLRTGWLDVTADRSGIVRLRADGSGRGRWDLTFARGLAAEGWEPTGRTRAVTRGSSASIGPYAVWRDEPISLPSGGPVSTPDRLEPGHSLGQTFRVPAGGSFRTVSIQLPTWRTSTSGAVLTLLHGTTTVASRVLRNVPDSSWQALEVPSPLGEGTYTIQVSDPVGDIGWWSSETDTLPDASAVADGRPLERDRAVRVDVRRLLGEGALRIGLAVRRMRIEADVRSAPGAPKPAALPWRWRTSWTKAGYDCTPRAGVVFGRFFTDNQRYMPAEQLKRREQAGLAFDGARWIHLSGTRGADLRVRGAALHLHWEMKPSEMALRLDSAVRRAAGGWRSEVEVVAMPFDTPIPGSFPRFELSDGALETDLNRFWWERGFTYPGPAGPSAWFEMMAIARCWFAGPQREGEIGQLRGYPITPEGYVHTWGQSIGWPFPSSPPYDTRHFDSNAHFILACWRYYLWTGDRAFLRGQAGRLRSAMRYQLDALRGREGLIVTVSKDVNGRHKGIGDNYWDILPFGHLDAYANIAFYASLEAMRALQQALGEAPLADYAALRRRARERYNATFWDGAKGRYIGCVDVDGARHDYGFTFVNLEAMHYGLASAAQARRIYRWMETAPTSTGKPDTYSRWVFAPRATTVHNPMWGDNAPPSERASKTPPWWMFGWTGTPYGDQCQDGGAILFTSFYDLMARARLVGPDNAWGRFRAIMARYRLPDRLCGGPPLYRGETPQQENPGQVGLDLPFPESGMVPCYVLYGVIGAEATAAGLRVTPRLPAGLRYAGVRGLSWHGLDIDLRVTATRVTAAARRAGRRLWTRRFALRPGGSALIRP